MVFALGLPILLLLCKTFAEDINHPACGLAEPAARIVDGQPISRAQIPWMVGLLLVFRLDETRNVQVSCGGSVISASYIMTAAHCVNYRGAMPFMAKAFYNSTIMHQGPSAWIEDMVYHPQFRWSDISHDIALVKVERPLTFGPYLKPVCLPTERLDLRGSVAVVAGWGYTQEAGRPSRILMYIRTRILPFEFCKVGVGYPWQIGDKNNGNILCTITPGKGSCEGDSGGPLTVWSPTYGRSLQVGIVSYGIGCARPNEPSQYTRVHGYLDWIRHILRQRRQSRWRFQTMVGAYTKMMKAGLSNVTDDVVLSDFL